MSTTLNYFTMVWGRKFTETFVSIVLPSLLSPKNLGECKNHIEDRYLLWTSQADYPILESSAAFRKLQSLVKTEVVFFEPGEIRIENGRPTYWDAWQTVSRFYGEAARRSAQNRAGLLLLSPDEVWADGGIESIRRIADTGKKVIIINGLATRLDTVVPLLRSYFYDSREDYISIKPRQLAKLASEHLHEYTALQSWDNPVRQNDSGTFLFPVANEGYILRTFGSSPQYFVHELTHEPWPIANGLEQIDHVNRIYDWKDIHILQDSDEIAMIGLEGAKFGDRDYKVNPEKLFQPASVLRQAVAMKEWFNPSKLHVGNFSLRWHWTDLSPIWDNCESRVNHLMGVMNESKAFFDRVPEALADFKAQTKLIDELLEERIWWLNLATQHESKLETVPRNSYWVSACSSLIWLHIVKNRSEEALRLVDKLMMIDPFAGQETLSRITPILQAVGQDYVADLIVKHAVSVLQQVRLYLESAATVSQSPEAL